MNYILFWKKKNKEIEKYFKAAQYYLSFPLQAAHPFPPTAPLRRSIKPPSKITKDHLSTILVADPRSPMTAYKPTNKNSRPNTARAALQPFECSAIID